MGVLFMYAPYVYWKMGAYQNVSPVSIYPIKATLYNRAIREQ